MLFAYTLDKIKENFPIPYFPVFSALSCFCKRDIISILLSSGFSFFWHPYLILTLIGTVIYLLSKLRPIRSIIISARIITTPDFNRLYFFLWLTSFMMPPPLWCQFALLHVVPPVSQTSISLPRFPKELLFSYSSRIY